MMTCLLGLLVAIHLPASPLVLAVGVNQPWDEALPRLQYADDDAAAAVELFGATNRTWLLTDMDPPTQERFPSLVAKTRAPSMEELKAAVGEMARMIDADQARGERPTVLLWISTHGDFDARGRPFLALKDGRLTGKQLLKRVLEPLRGAHRIHLILDACHAEAVLRFRARVDPASAEEVVQQSFDGLLAGLDHAGALLASASQQQTFEWDRMRSGIFSALVRSGLRGAANADQDDCVTYEEMVAYLTASTQGIGIPEARPRVVGYPPSVDRQAPLVCRSWLGQVRDVSLDLSTHGITEVEDHRGVFMAGGRFEPHTTTWWLPTDVALYLHSQRGEWRLDGTALVELAPTGSAPPPLLYRGAAEEAVKRGLFAVPYGPAYLGGFKGAWASSGGLRPRAPSNVDERTAVAGLPTPAPPSQPVSKPGEQAATRPQTMARATPRLSGPTTSVQATRASAVTPPEQEGRRLPLWPVGVLSALSGPPLLLGLIAAGGSAMAVLQLIRTDKEREAVEAAQLMGAAAAVSVVAGMVGIAWMAAAGAWAVVRYVVG